MSKRQVEICVISDTHLGTYGCHATELYQYLLTIKPEILILNGDFIDMWQFRKRYWPQMHFKVLEQLLKMLNEGTIIYYLSGNHDEMLRRFSELNIGKLKFDDKLLLLHDNKVHWIFHGDVFDVTMKHSKWLAKLGSTGYDLLILLNRFINNALAKMGRDKISLSKKIKNSVKKAVSFISDFENTAANIAIDKKYDVVICGHIHKPEIKTIKTERGEVLYLNSGDWVENLTSLEYYNGKWNLYHYTEEPKTEKSVPIQKQFVTA
jgi:UDP-2,3-diacylglucosamine pyrophosphatase LpxH